MTSSNSFFASQGPQRALLSLAALVAFLVVAVVSQDYCAICPNHTMCVNQGVATECLSGVSASGVPAADQDTIVSTHNTYRNKVASGGETRGKSGSQPSAANMQRLSWDSELASIAQRWADQCNFTHDSCRKVDRFYVGQNLALTGSSPCSATSDKNAQWASAIKMWYDEVDNMDRAVVANFQSGGAVIGHYTQVVWGTTTKVGCGYRLYQDGAWCRKFYACNYGEGGNWLGQPVYKEGNSRTQCASQGTVDPTYPALC